jgi:hypothetical protein
MSNQHSDITARIVKKATALRAQAHPATQVRASGPLMVPATVNADRPSSRPGMPKILAPQKDMAWTHQPGDKYFVTGLGTDGEHVHLETTSIVQAALTGLREGTKYAIRHGVRTPIQTVRRW